MNTFPKEIACVAIYVDSTETRVRGSIIVTDITKKLPKYLHNDEWWLCDYENMDQIYSELDHTISILRKRYPTMNIIHVEDVPLSKDNNGRYHSSIITRDDYLKILRDKIV
jgi:hypothetical protein